MKRTFALIILLSLVLSMVCCQSDPYPAVASSFEEREVVMTFEADGDVYEIKYELYRALFVANKVSVDGGDDAVWSSDNKAEYILKINEIIAKKAAEIYAVFHHARKIGINPYSSDMDSEVKEWIRIGVEGGYGISGFGGDYDAYLDALKQSGINYSVQDLLLRYSLTLDKINVYYHGKEDEALGRLPAEYKLNDELVREFYFSDESARILHAYMQDGVSEDTAGKMESIRLGMINAEGAVNVALYIINHTSMTPTDLIKDKMVSGVMIGKNSLKDIYSEYVNQAFSISEGEVSSVIKVNDGEVGYYVIYKANKTEEHFDRCYDDVKTAYLDNLIGSTLNKIEENLVSTIKYESGYNKIDHSKIGK